VSAAPERCRADVWLWRARFFKSRSLATAALNAGAVRLARGDAVKRAEPATAVLPGDALVFAGLDGRVRSVRVLALGSRRGPPAEAQGLYQDLQPPLDDDASGSS